MSALVIFTTDSDVVHAALPHLLAEDLAGRALCGTEGFAETIAGQLLSIDPTCDDNVTCARCRRSQSWC
jgi:hypothetical protein